MPVVLTATLPNVMDDDERLCVIDEGLVVDGFRLVPDLAEKLEHAFDGTFAPWREIALLLQEQRTAEWAHMPTMSTYASDFGIMLAWRRVVQDLLNSKENVRVVCSDPWLFRALACLQGVVVETPPGIAAKRLRFFLRGLAARTRVAMRCLLARWRTHSHRKAAKASNWILVYGHPDSNADGEDAYFGNLMHVLPNLKRMMHTDCPASFALQLAKDDRTSSLHAWGNFCTALQLPFTRWSPSTANLEPSIAWLVKRAAAIEGSGGSAAMTRWQMTCQQRWLRETKPKAVTWPWENHPWERDFSRKARENGTRTLGYQHTVVGRHMFNQGATANADDLRSIPDKILLNGPAYADDLADRGIPREQMIEVGSFRIKADELPTYDPKGPVFVALSNNPTFAQQMIAATRPLADAFQPFLVKDHPLCPFDVDESAHFERTKQPFADLPPIRALIYCTGTSGLQGLLSGVPTLRFIPEGGVALDILPRGTKVTSVDAKALSEALQNPAGAVNHADRTMVSAPDLDQWGKLLGEQRVEI